MREWTTLKKYIWLLLLRGASAIIKTVTGTAPLVLENAIAAAIKSLKQYGKCTQPSGVWNTAITQFGKVEQRNLPSGYTQAEYIQGDGTSGYVNTGIVINSIDTEVEVDFQFTATPGGATPAMVWGYMGNSSNLPRWGFGAYGGQWLGSVNQTSAVGSFDTSRHTAVMRVYMDGESPMWDGTLDGEALYPASALPSPTPFTGNTLPVFLLARNNNGTVGNFAPVKVWGLRVRKAGVLTNFLVPCKDSTGYYDTVTGEFHAGSGTLTAGPDAMPSPSTPMDIWTNNGRLMFGKPLTLDPTRYYAYIDSSVGWKWINESYSIAIPVTVGKKYKIELSTTESSLVGTILRYCFVDNVYDTWKQGVKTPTPNTIAYYNAVRTTPQDYVPTELTAEHPYLIIQMAVGNFASILTNGYLTVTEQEVYADGTPEVLTVGGKNLLDPSTVTDRKYINASGQEVPSYTTTGWLNHSDYIAVTAGEDYTLYVTGAYGGNTIAFNWFDANKTILATRPTQNVTSGTTAYTFTNTAPADAAYLIVNFIVGTNVMVEESSTATAYEPYVTPQTASVPMLLGVGDYKDTTEFIQGIKTGKVGVKVLDGTEGWVKGTSFYADISLGALQSSHSCICSHFVGKSTDGYTADSNTIQVGYSVGSTTYWNRMYITANRSDYATTADFKAWLAAQYAAGTPVIVIYPLATETTGSTTAYPQLCNKLYNTAKVEAEVDDIQVTFTTGEQTVPNPYSPLSIVCNNGELKWNGTSVVADGTPEVLTVSGKNLYNKADGVLKGYPSATGTWNGRSGDTSELSIIVTLEEGKTYTAQRASGGNCSFRVMGSANRPLEQGQSLMVISSPSSITDNVTTFTVPSGYPHIVFYVRNNAGTSLTIEDVVNAFQVEFGSEATAYESYVQPQTVSDIPMLLAVGDYKDEGEIISGLLTHKVGIKVLTGDNTKDGYWGTSGGASNLYSLTIADSSTSNTFSPISTHFVGVLGSVGYASIQDGQFKHGSNANTYYFKDTSSEDVTAFKAKLAAQYAAGTPVIVIYPLATEITESGTEQPLTTSVGTNTVSVTSNVDPVELEIEYSASA